MEKIFDSFFEEETFKLAENLGKKAQKGDIYCLDGDLGVGKTVFAKGFAKGLSIGESVSSPTFTILKEYPDGRLPLYHFDVYRIADEDELYETGYEEYFFGNGVCLIEWAELIPDLIPENAVFIKIKKEPEKGFDYRRISINFPDNKFQKDDI